MTRDKMKSIFCVHTNGEDEYIKVPKRTYDKMIDMFCDAHEAEIRAKHEWVMDQKKNKQSFILINLKNQELSSKSKIRN